MLKKTVLAVCVSAWIPNPIRAGAVPVLEAPGNRVQVRNASELADAVANAAAGRTILIRDGTYDLAAFEPLRIRRDGISLYGVSRDPTKVILRGGGFGSADLDEEMIKVEAAGFTLAYLTLRDVRANGLKLQTGPNHGVLVHNVHFLDICERSIKSTEAGTALNGTVRYCLFEQITPITPSIPNLRFEGDYVGGMDMMRIQGWKIHDNVFKNIRGRNGGGRAAVFLWRGCKNVVVERNIFVGCDRAVAFGNPGSVEPDMIGGVIRNNFIVAGAGNSLEVCNSSASLVAHNTVFSRNPAYRRAVFFYRSGPGNRLQNNLVLGGLSVLGGSRPDTARNLFLSTPGAASNWFRNAAAGDLHLKAAAARARDKAAPLPEIPEDIDGEARLGEADIGADEFHPRAPLNPGNF